MKANVPEKIYVHKSKYWGLMANEHNITKESIEYIRTDVFIEKARKWFIEHTNVSQEVDIDEDGEPLADSYIKYAEARLDAANEMFENFKNYMKGE